MVARPTSLRCAAIGILLALCLTGCDALFFDLDTIPLQPADVSETAGDADGTAPPVDADAGGGEDTAPTDSSAPDTGDTAPADDVPPADTAPDTSPADPAASCLAVASCAYLACPDLEESCVTNAVSYGKQPAVKKAGNLTKCARSNDCDYYFEEDCLDANCSSSNQACLGAKPQGFDLSCFEIVTCRRHCGDDANCASDCVDQGSFLGRRYFGALQGCLREECRNATPGEQDECLRTECSKEFKDCMQCP